MGPREGNLWHRSTHPCNTGRGAGTTLQAPRPSAPTPTEAPSVRASGNTGAAGAGEGPPPCCPSRHLTQPLPEEPADHLPTRSTALSGLPARGPRGQKASVAEAPGGKEPQAQSSWVGVTLRPVLWATHPQNHLDRLPELNSTYSAPETHKMLGNFAFTQMSVFSQ